VEAGPAGLPGRRVAAGACSAAVALGALDTYVVVTIASAIMADLEIPITHLERAIPIVTGYLLGYIAAMPLLGQLSDRMGRRSVIRGCLASFAAGSAVSALAPSLAILVLGRVVQGAAGGALLPVTFAVIGDRWGAEERPVPLGMVGAVQEVGSLLGPLYGAGVAAALGWRGVFWLNVPVVAVLWLVIGRTLPRTRPGARARLDLVGGAILTTSLALLILGLYNPDPSRGVLAPWGVPAVTLAAAGLVAFLIWERRSPQRFIDPSEARMRPLAAALGCSLLAGAALMATLVDIPLLAQTLLGKDTLGGALVLSRFLGALGAGALAGGLLTKRFGARPVTVAGLLVAAAAFWLISGWPLDLAGAVYRIGPLRVTRLAADLILAGLGLGVIVAPLASVALSSTSDRQHGVASAAVVVSRATGMLVGVAALTAAGTNRFQELTANLSPPLPIGLSPRAFASALAAYDRGLRAALHVEYREIFLATAMICLAGAAVGLALGGRKKVSGRGSLPPQDGASRPES
jgi:MFS family permease